MSKIQKDIQFGLSKEYEVLDILKDHFKIPNLRKTVYRYCLMDFTSDKYEFELKSRRFEYNKYPTTIIGDNKIKYALSSHKTTIFVFNFTDGIYYIKYDKDIFKDFKTQIDIVNFNDIPEQKFNCYIPINKLTKIEKIT